MSEPPATPWYFHDSPMQLDDPKAQLPLPTTGGTAPPSTDTQEQTNDEKPKDEIPEALRANPQMAEAQEKYLVRDRMIRGHGDEDDECLDSGTQTPQAQKPIFSTTNYLGSVNPNANWTAFNPSDNAHLEIEARKKKAAEVVPVGLNRLYGVSMRSMVMTPIYWASNHQVSNVHRSEWFFSNTLTPAEPTLESQLLEAYNQVRPWTTEYLSELKAAIGVPEALDKIKVPVEYTQWNSGGKEVKHSAVAVFAPCGVGLKVEPDETELSKLHELSKSLDSVQTTQYPVVYLLPASTYALATFIGAGTTPVQLLTALLSGKQPPGTLLTLQRHFSWDAWKQLKSLPDRPTDAEDFVPKKINQLVLVIHGIGQKLSDRLESFNFTYAINDFRILVEDQASRPSTKPFIDEGIMILPVNWRRTLKFEFEQLKRGKDGELTTKEEEFSLQDITVPSIPAVRNIITDVMLDIPYYMSQHKDMITEAVVNEANRVYRLFCDNHPGFKDDGTVNVIGHSLGSVIALDILSAQPTDFQGPQPPDRRAPKLEFNTSNCFLVGSPTGFFLLLESRKLSPRKLHDDKHKNVPPSYGCMAVDNIYNIFHYSDPVANLLNSTVDPLYAATLKTAALPSEKLFPVPGADTSGLLDQITAKLPHSFTFWGENSSGKAPEEDEAKVAAAAVAEKLAEFHESHLDQSVDSLESERPPLPSSMPSSVELETRDFDREYQGEEKMHLLNDNGQIDFMVPLTGTLENQYFSMLTAHSGYWENKDFARMVAIECGRKRGKDNAWVQYKAQKK